MLSTPCSLTLTKTHQMWPGEEIRWNLVQNINIKCAQIWPNKPKKKVKKNLLWTLGASSTYKFRKCVILRIVLENWICSCKDISELTPNVTFGLKNASQTPCIAVFSVYILLVWKRIKPVWNISYVYQVETKSFFWVWFENHSSS